MSNITELSVQKILKPKIEEVLPYYLYGEELESALKFIAYLRADKINPGWANVHNAWKGSYKGKPVYYIRLGREWVRDTKNVKWVIIVYLNHIREYEEKIFEESWQNIIWDDLHHCRRCNNGCAPGVDRTILGKEFTGLCNGIFYSGRFPVSFVNPVDTDIIIIKKMLELEKSFRAQSIPKSDKFNIY